MSPVSPHPLKKESGEFQCACSSKLTTCLTDNMGDKKYWPIRCLVACEPVRESDPNEHFFGQQLH